MGIHRVGWALLQPIQHGSYRPSVQTVFFCEFLSRLVGLTSACDARVRPGGKKTLNNQQDAAALGEYSKSSFEDDSYYIAIRYPISFNIENIIARFVLRENEIKFYDNCQAYRGFR